MHTTCTIIIVILILLLFLKPREKFVVPGTYTTTQMAEKYNKQCSAYNVALDPSKLENYPFNFSSDNFLPSGQCPDSTFTFTTDLSRVIPGAKPVPSCVQLKDEPFCYSTPDGKFQPNLQRALTVTV
jgi:hypothetical protein